MAKTKKGKGRKFALPYKPVVIVGRPYTPEYGAEACNVFVLTVDAEIMDRVRRMAAAAKSVDAAYISAYCYAALSVYSRLPARYAREESALEAPGAPDAPWNQNGHYLVHYQENGELDLDDTCSRAEEYECEQSLDCVYLRVWVAGSAVSFQWEFRQKHCDGQCETPSMLLDEVEGFMHGLQDG